MIHSRLAITKETNGDKLHVLHAHQNKPYKLSSPKFWFLGWWPVLLEAPDSLYDDPCTQNFPNAGLIPIQVQVRTDWELSKLPCFNT